MLCDREGCGRRFIRPQRSTKRDDTIDATFCDPCAAVLLAEDVAPELRASFVARLLRNWRCYRIVAARDMRGGR